MEGWPQFDSAGTTVGRGALLLPLAYAATLSLAGVSAVALALLDAEHATSSGVAATLAADEAIVRDGIGGRRPMQLGIIRRCFLSEFTSILYKAITIIGAT